MVDELRMRGYVAIGDIGGNQGRHARHQRHDVWSMCPTLSGADVLRNQRAAEANVGNWCDDRVQDCGHQFDALMSVHSLYYLTAKEIYDLLRTRQVTLLAAVHIFPDPRGLLWGGEAEYHVSHSGWVFVTPKVSMIANGNTSAYAHDSMSWLRDGAYHGEEGTLVWQEWRRYGHTIVFEFAFTQLVIAKANVHEPLLTESILDHTHYGAIDLRGYHRAETRLVNPGYETVSMRDFTVRAFGVTLGIYPLGRDVPVVVPKRFIQELANRLTGRPRDAANLRYAQHQATTLVRYMNITPDVASVCMVEAVSLALMCNLERETHVLNNVVGNPRSLEIIANHKRAIGLDFDAPWYVRAYRFMRRHPVLTAACVGGLAFWLSSSQLNDYAHVGYDVIGTPDLPCVLPNPTPKPEDYSTPEGFAMAMVSDAKMEIMRPDSNLMYARFGAPVVEELFKRLHPLACAAFIVGESSAKLMNGVPLGAVALCAAMHLLWVKLPFAAGVACHSAWNIGASWKQVLVSRGGVFESMPGPLAQVPIVAPPAIATFWPFAAEVRYFLGFGALPLYRYLKSHFANTAPVDLLSGYGGLFASPLPPPLKARNVKRKKPVFCNDVGTIHVFCGDVSCCHDDARDLILCAGDLATGTREFSRNHMCGCSKTWSCDTHVPGGDEETMNFHPDRKRRVVVSDYVLAFSFRKFWTMITAPVRRVVHYMALLRLKVAHWFDIFWADATKPDVFDDVNKKFDAFKNTRESFSFDCGEPIPILRPETPVVQIPFEQKEIDKDAMMKAPPTSYTRDPITGARLIGIGVSDRMPVVSDGKNTDTEMSGLQGRTLAPKVAEANEALIDEYGQWVKDNFFDLFPRPDEGYAVQPTRFSIWNSRFTAPLQKRHCDARQTAQTFGVEARDFRKSLFVKVEKLMKTDESGLEHYDPRIIAACSDVANVIAGPWCHAFSKKIGEIWNVDHPFMLYAPGNSSNQLGAWLTETLDIIQKPVPFENDCRLFDSSLLKKIMEIEMWVAEQFADPLDVGWPGTKVVLTDYAKRLFGKSKTGVAVKGEGRASGIPVTSIFNGMTTLTTQLFCFCKATGLQVRDLYPRPDAPLAGLVTLRRTEADIKMGVPMSELELREPRIRSIVIRMVASGDDSAGVHTVFDDGVRKIIDFSLLSQLGFRPKTKYDHDLSDFSFCSGLFWPVPLSELTLSTGRLACTRYMFGPKPGRILSRLGWTEKTVSNSLVWLKGNCLGLRDSVQHVPLAKEYVNHILHLTLGIEARPMIEEHKMKAEFSCGYDELVDDNGKFLGGGPTWTFFSNRYCLDHADYQHIVRLIRKVRSFPVLVSDPLLTRILEIDLA